MLGRTAQPRVSETNDELSLVPQRYQRIKSRAKNRVKRAFPDVFFRTPHSTLEPERLYVYLDALWTRRDIAGPIVEVGCYVGGTAAVGARLLRNIGVDKRYVCVDTFGGFVEDDFDSDVDFGVPEAHRHMFGETSLRMVRRLLVRYGVPEVELVEADVSRLDVEALPAAVSVALIDVDLERPTFEALKRIVPRLAPGGVALVDDCNEEAEWKGAKRAYDRFMELRGAPPIYRLGMGIIEAAGDEPHSRPVERG